MEPHVDGAARLLIGRLPIAPLSPAYVHIALEHSSPERVEATFCSAGRTGRIGLLVMGRLRSFGCVMFIETSASREDGARSLCVRVTQCTARGELQRDYATPTVDSQRRGAKQGKEACMRRSERAVRTPWRQERRQRYAQETRHLSSAMRHRWGRALTGVCTGRRRDQGARPTEILHFLPLVALGRGSDASLAARLGA